MTKLFTLKLTTIEVLIVLQALTWMVDNVNDAEAQALIDLIRKQVKE